MSMSLLLLRPLIWLVMAFCAIAKDIKFQSKGKGDTGRDKCHRRSLKFIHIPKTGGTTIENLGHARGYAWGRYHKHEYGFWHDYLYEKSLNLINKYDWFMFVRNPFDRVVSEYWCKWGGVGRPNETTVENFNGFIQKMVTNPPTTTARGHWLPMAPHLRALSMSPGVTIHVGRFERFESDLKRILKSYNIEYLEHFPKINDHAAERAEYNVSHLDRHTVELIQRVYAMDFEIFGYDIEPSNALLR